MLNKLNYRFTHKRRNPICIILVLFFYLWFHCMYCTTTVSNKYSFSCMHIQIPILMPYTFIYITLVGSVFTNSSFYSNFLGPTGPFMVLPGPKIVLRIYKWCLWTLLIYRENFHFLNLHQLMLLSLFPKCVEDRQTVQVSYRSDFSLLKNWYLIHK